MNNGNKLARGPAKEKENIPTNENEKHTHTHMMTRAYEVVKK